MASHGSELALLGEGSLPEVDERARGGVYARAGLSESAISQVEEMIASSGQRKVGKGALRNVIVRHQSRKNGQPRFVESHTVEQVFALELELDPEVLAYYCQVRCPRVEYVSASGHRTVNSATIDFLVLRFDAVQLVECKTRDWVEAITLDDARWSKEPYGWSFQPYANFAQKVGISFRVWVSPEAPGIYLRNLHAIYAFSNEQTTEAETHVLQLAVLYLVQGPATVARIAKDIPGFGVKLALRLVGERLAYSALRSIALDDAENAYLYNDPVQAARADESYTDKLALQAAQIEARDPWLAATPKERARAEKRLARLLSIKEGTAAPSRRMAQLQVRVDNSLAAGTPALHTLITQHKKSGNRTARVAHLHVEIARATVKEMWCSGIVKSAIDLYVEFRARCVNQGIEPCSRKLVDRLRNEVSPQRRALAVGGMRAYQAAVAATDPLARSLPAMGFGHTAHIDSSKFDVRFAPCIISQLPAACATFYIAVDEASGYPLGYSFIFGSARTDGIALLLRDIVRRNGFLPRLIHLDRGPENRADFLDKFCNGRITQRYSPTGGSKWNGIAENTIKQINDQVANRLPGSTWADKAGRKIDGSFKSAQTARLQFLDVIKLVDEFIYSYLARKPDNNNRSPTQHRIDLITRIGCMGFPTTFDDDFVIQTSVPVPLLRRVDARRGIRTTLGYYTSDVLIAQMRSSKLVEARADCNYPETIYAMFADGSYVRAFLPSLQHELHHTDLHRLFSLLYAPILRAESRNAKIALMDEFHPRIQQSLRTRDSTVSTFEAISCSKGDVGMTVSNEIDSDSATFEALEWESIEPFAPGKLQ